MGPTKTDLEEDLDAHGQYAVYDPERKDEGHGIDVQAQEPPVTVSTAIIELPNSTHGSEATESCTSTEAK